MTWIWRSGSQGGLNFGPELVPRVCLRTRSGSDAPPADPAVCVAHGSPPGSGQPLAGQLTDLCCRYIKQLLEVSGELVGAKVAVRGDDVLDRPHAQGRVLQVAIACLQPQPFDQFHRRKTGALEQLVQVARRDAGGLGDLVRAERGVAEVPADDGADVCRAQ